jgi:hypothetical protein
VYLVVSNDAINPVSGMADQASAVSESVFLGLNSSCMSNWYWQRWWYSVMQITRPKASDTALFFNPQVIPRTQSAEHRRRLARAQQFHQDGAINDAGHGAVRGSLGDV